MHPVKVVIGYDAREAIAYHTCVNSIIRNSSVPVQFIPIALKNIKGVYEENHNTENGKTGYQPTNQFIFSRFLSPYLAGFKGLAIFMDGDMIVRDGVEIKEILEHHQIGKAVSVVKHDYQTKYPIKYLGQKNEDYPRKNWSSVIVWDCGHLKNKVLTPEYVMNASGAHLHRFEWLDEHFVGELPIEWNWLPDELGPNPEAKLLHYTAGTPCFHDYACSPMADEWHREKIYTTHSHQIGID